MAKFTCDIVTPEAKCYTGEAHFVVVPGTEGEMGFLSGHVPLVSTLSDGVVRVARRSSSSRTKPNCVKRSGYLQALRCHVV